MPSKAFNELIAARVWAASLILGDAKLLKSYCENGGKQSDLEGIRDSGLAAEAANQGQGAVAHETGADTAKVLAEFAALQREYSAVMGIVTAVKADLKLSGADPALVLRLEKILANETQVSLVATGGDGSAKKAARRSTAQEPVRAEIEKDASELLAFAQIQQALAERGVPQTRLEALKARAVSFAGLLGARAAKKGARKAATAAETKAVEEQTLRWAGAYRILRNVSLADARVAEALRAAAR